MTREEKEDLEEIKWRIFSAHTSLRHDRISKLIGEKSCKKLRGCLERSYLILDNFITESREIT